MKHAMQRQQDPLNLQGLPQVAPPRDGWPAIETALRQDNSRRTFRRYAGAVLAAAAVLALALTLVLQQPSPGIPVDAPDLSAQRGLEASGEGEATALVAGSPAPAASLDSLMSLSQRLEGRLRSYRAGLGDLPASDLVYQVELEDLVVQVDEELSARPDSLALWNQRVTLLMDLERLYQNRLRREYRQMASL